MVDSKPGPRTIRSTIFALLLGAALPACAPTASATVSFSCAFASSPTDCGFFEQSYALPRATIVNTVARDGNTSVRLHTEPGDTNVAGSGSNERDDLALPPAASYCNPGQEEWWAHSTLFPDDYVDPPESTDSTWNWAVVFDFHNTAPGGGQANFQINAWPTTAIASDRPTGLGFQVAYGSQTSPTVYRVPIGPVVEEPLVQLRLPRQVVVEHRRLLHCVGERGEEDGLQRADALCGPGLLPQARQLPHGVRAAELGDPRPHHPGRRPDRCFADAAERGYQNWKLIAPCDNSSPIGASHRMGRWLKIIELQVARARHDSRRLVCVSPDCG